MAVDVMNEGIEAALGIDSECWPAWKLKIIIITWMWSVMQYIFADILNLRSDYSVMRLQTSGSHICEGEF